MLKVLSTLTLMIVCLGIQAQSTLRVTSPASIAGDYPIAKGLFGNGFIDTLKGELIVANNGSGSSLACDTIANNIQGKIVMIDRGTCTFVEKVLRAQRGGAKALIIIHNAATGIGAFGSFDPAITIPSVMISQANGAKIKAAAAGAQAFLYFNDPTGSEPVLYSETFSGGKGAWTSVGITAPKDTFVWDRRGLSHGALGGYRIDAPTADNGAMVFDADFLTTQGDTLKIPSGPASSYPRHKGELISPIINCSTFNSVTLKFFQLYAGLNGTSSISYSIDGGTTWANPIEVNEDVQPNTTSDLGGFIKMELPQLANKAQARIKFIFDGDFYAWIIDDVKLLGKSPFDIAVQPNQFFFPFNFATPASQITTDTSSFSADIANFGTNAGANLKMKVQVTNSAGAFLHRDSITIANLPSGARDTTFFFPKSYIPGKLDPGVYNLKYSIEGPAGFADADPTNNSQSQDFIITTDLYTKDDGQNISSGLRALSLGDYFFGNIYNTSTDWKATDKFSASEVTFGAFMATEDGQLKGKSATIYLAELLPTLNSDFSNFDEAKPITEHPQLKIVGTGTHDFTENQSEIATITLLETGNFNEKVPLKKGTRYLVGVSYKDAANKAYQFVESDIQYFYIGTLFYTSGQWSASPDAPVIRMRLDISTGVDEITLPDYTLQLSPNPTTDLIRAKVNFDKATDANFVIADVTGRVLQMHTKKGILKETFEFNIRELAAGTYLMRISTDDGTKTKKFVVQR